jgi:hypothetical protein
MNRGIDLNSAREKNKRKHGRLPRQRIPESELRRRRREAQQAHGPERAAVSQETSRDSGGTTCALVLVRWAFLHELVFIQVFWDGPGHA